MERSRPRNISADLLLQQTSEDEVSFSAVVEAIRDKNTQSGKKYQSLEFIDSKGELRRVSVWDKKLTQDLKVGDVVDLTLHRNDKGFWNIASLTRSGINLPPAPTEPTPPSNAPEASSNPIPADRPDKKSSSGRSDENKPSQVPRMASLAPVYQPQNLDPREYRLMSMNALNNAVSFVSAFKELLKPQSIEQAFNLVERYHQLMMDLHKTKDEPGESK